MNVKILSYLLMGLLLIACTTSRNQLIGAWEFDGDRTLSELESNKNTPEKVLACYRKRFCGYEVQLTFTNSTWSQLFLSNPVSSPEKIPYRVVRATDSEVEIRTTILGVDATYVTYFVNESLAYVYVEIDGFKWKDYLKRIR